MKSYDDKKKGGAGSKAWDEGINYHEVKPEGGDHRPVGFVQDVSTYWVMPDAAAYADEVKKARRHALRTGSEFKMPRPPPGFPVMCPRFDPFREEYVDYRDPTTGHGFKAGEVITVKDLKRAGVALPSTLKKAERVLESAEASKSAKRAAKEALASARFARRSIDLNQAIELVEITDPLYTDFRMMANRRTMMHTIDRKKCRKGALSDDAIGIPQRGGVPWTAWQQMERVGQLIKGNPFDSEHGWDVNISKNPRAAPALMWSISHLRETPLTPEERTAVYGRYKLSDGTKVGYDRILELKRESEERDSKGSLTEAAKKAIRLLRDYKTLRATALYPLDEMIAAAMISGEELKAKLVACGYYDEEGNPRPELIQEVKGKGKSKWSESDDDDDDDDDDLEDEPRRKPKARVIDDDDDESPRKSSKKTRAHAYDDDEDGDSEEDSPPAKKTKKTSKKRKFTVLDD